MFRTGQIKSALFALFAGALLASPASAASKPFMEQNMDRWGSDYSIFEISTGGANACYQACAKDKKCLAWTYHIPGTKAEKGVCHLKSQVPHGSRNECCTSGILIGQGDPKAHHMSPASYYEGDRKAVKARRTFKARAAEKFFRKASVDEGEAIGLPEMKAAAFAPPTQITPMSFDISEEF